PPVVAVGPAVIDALETAPVALALGADDGAAVAAGVEQAMERTGLIAAEDHRPAGDLARAEIAGLSQLGGMADIDPAAAEDLRRLLAQHLLRDQNLAIEQEGLLLAVVDDIGTHRHLLSPLGFGRSRPAAVNRMSFGLRPPQIT